MAYVNYNVPLIVGSVLTRGHSDIITTYSNKTYKDANAGAKYIPIGTFCAFVNDGSDNMVVADETNAYGVALSPLMYDIGIPNWSNGQTSAMNNQSFCMRAIDLVVLMDASDIATAKVGMPVFVNSDGLGTINGSADQLSVGVLKSPIQVAGQDPFGFKVGAVAYIDLTINQLVTGGGVLPEVEKEKVTKNNKLPTNNKEVA